MGCAVEFWAGSRVGGALSSSESLNTCTCVSGFQISLRQAGDAGMHAMPSFVSSMINTPYS